MHTGHFAPVFLSTSPARGTTQPGHKPLFRAAHFYPRPPRGGRLRHGGAARPTGQFLSTSPARGTTTAEQIAEAENGISIHVPREGDDPTRCGGWNAPWHFYPRPPRGGRPARHRLGGPCKDFYPRPPRGGRRSWPRPPTQRPAFLSTSPARGTTRQLGTRRSVRQDFYPRPPRGGRRTLRK